ncbi:MAG: Ni/Fe hydrogenase subunit alpha [Eggerthellaceae bacterium]|jgi:coenzyme F420-reducing hydrogenase alpha subunit|nr:Ni/Fe hydrogenase subunit alpha [Eggerthellaceae bacterium]MCH4220334.1 Ni/Fe hydrogenase subunit alpha [Eggerthellaceae bacterium]
MTQCTIDVDHIARVEGHGNVHVVVEGGQVKDVEMNIVEPIRLFESMVRGRSYRDVSYIASRVCGICSASHVVTDLKAIERIFGVELSQRTKMLRELLIYGSYLQNHGAHLFVFAAPDYLGETSIFPVSKSNPELFSQALDLKSLGNELCTMVGGRSIHPITAVIGGFTHEISSQEYLDLADKLESKVPFALETVDLFNGFDICDVASDNDYMALTQPGAYPVQASDTLTFVGSDESFDANDITDHISEYQVGHSAAFFARRTSTDRPYMTGALARINASWENLTPKAKVAAAKAGLRPPERNPLRNNVAQAVEIVDALERCAELCRELAEGDQKESLPRPFKVCAGSATGVTEAPRGTVAHQLVLDDKGVVQHASIITPTAQNLAAMESDIRKMATSLVAQGVTEDELVMDVEKMVRAYDPCLSCSVH